MNRIVAPISILLLLSACSLNKKQQATTSPAKFCIPDSLVNEVVINTAILKPIEDEIRLIGKVTYDQDKVVKIYPMVSGNVQEVKVALGDYVEKGQVLAIVKSSEIVSAENDIVSSEANLAVSEKTLEATEGLFKNGLVSEKENTSALKDVEKAKSEVNKAKTTLSIFGGVNSNYIIKSPISGYIVDKSLNPEMQIRPDNSTNIFTISDLKRIWVMADVYETDIAKIKVGEKVNVSTIAYPDKIIEGTIDKIYSVLDPDSKTMKVRIQLSNSENLLKPEMFANVIVHQVKKDSLVAVPSKSVIFDRNRYWIVVYKDKCNVETRQVEISTTTSAFTYLKGGIKSGESVIMTNQLLIYNALNQ